LFSAAYCANTRSATIGYEIRRSKISFFILSITRFPLRFSPRPSRFQPDRAGTRAELQLGCAHLVSEGPYPITLSETCHASIEARLAPKKAAADAATSFLIYNWVANSDSWPAVFRGKARKNARPKNR
jgi:hypothetical protein